MEMICQISADKEIIIPENYKMDKIINIKRYICGREEFNFSDLYRKCSIGKKLLPVNVFLIEHKKRGNILINTGCSSLLKKNPTSFAALLTKHRLSFTKDDEICTQLLKEGSDPLIIKKVLLTQCTPDCCGGLPMLPRYELISTAQVMTVHWLADPSDGVMKSTLAGEEIKKTAAGLYKGTNLIKDYFKWVFDVFGDGTVLALDLSGYAKAMAGFFLTEKNIFFAADASIDMTAVEEGLVPGDKLLSRAFYPDDYISVLATLRRLHKEHPEIRFLFSHSEEDI